MLWHHDLHRVRELTAPLRGQLTAQLRWSLLWFDTYLISVSREPLALCSVERTGGDLAWATAPNEAVAQRLGGGEPPAPPRVLASPSRSEHDRCG